MTELHRNPRLAPHDLALIDHHLTGHGGPAPDTLAFHLSSREPEPPSSLVMLRVHHAPTKVHALLARTTESATFPQAWRTLLDLARHGSVASETPVDPPVTDADPSAVPDVTVAFTIGGPVVAISRHDPQQNTKLHVFADIENDPLLICATHTLWDLACSAAPIQDFMPAPKAQEPADQGQEKSLSFLRAGWQS